MEEAEDEPLFRERAAGIDIGKQMVMVTVRVPSEARKGGRRQETREFGTTRRQLLELADWLRSWGVERAGMEAMMVFPGNRVDGKPTINVARGLNRKISDRMDLTLECIRRYYRHEDSPMAATLGRYASFFALFEDFRGYVDFFLLQDLVSSDCEAVGFFMSFNGFNPPAVPMELDTYLEFRRLSIEFAEARNRRIDELALDVD
jgi:hypothetical protein